MSRQFIGFICTFILLTSEQIVGGSAAQAAGDGSSRSIWPHDGSTMYLVANGFSLEFDYQARSDGMRSPGARGEGTLLFRGQSNDTRYSGTAYVFSRRCGSVPYQVAGRILDNYERVLLKGQAPRLGAGCKPQSFVADILKFRLVYPSSDAPAEAQLSLPNTFVGVWKEAAAERSSSKATAWHLRDRDTVRVIKTAGQSLTGWKFACSIGSLERPRVEAGQQKQSAIVELSCGGEGGEIWNSVEKWALHATTLKLSTIRDNAHNGV